MKLLKVFGLLILALWGGWLRSQTNIGGVVNSTLTKVTAQNTVANSVDVSSVAGFAIGDTVLLIQMKGATIDVTNTAAFGNVTAIGSAGLYEFAVICGISGNTVTFDQQLLNTYSPAAGYVQMIYVPVYQNVVVNSALTANRWNGVTGGVLVFRALGWVRLDADVSMAGLGFRAGYDYSNYGTCGCSCGGGQFPDFSYATNNCRAADKGEGIADSATTRGFGKGKEATGGGGGNDHNAGGAGGGNFGAGGAGGSSNNPTCVAGAYCRGLNPGVGGLGLGVTYYSTAQKRIFMGGGGGAGHDNNGTGTAGAPGGGIVIIWADSLNLNGRTISSAGSSQSIPTTSDGAGGGGAGGVVALDVRAIPAIAGTLRASGGNGGIDNWASPANNCKGPGGGGGGGVIWSRSALPGAVTTVVTGGANGTNCAGAAGSTSGAVGTVLTGLTTVISSTDYAGCNLLPVEFASFTATPWRDMVELAWVTSHETNSAYFLVERAADGVNFQVVGRADAAGNSSRLQEYTFPDRHPLTGRAYYRIRQIDLSGVSQVSDVRVVTFSGSPSRIAAVYPNPVREEELLTVDFREPAAENMQAEIVDIRGAVLQTFRVQTDAVQLNLPVRELAPGLYFLRITSGSARETVRFTRNP